MSRPAGRVVPAARVTAAALLASKAACAACAANCIVTVNSAAASFQFNTSGELTHRSITEVAAAITATGCSGSSNDLFVYSGDNSPHMTGQGIAKLKEVAVSNARHKSNTGNPLMTTTTATITVPAQCPFPTTLGMLTSDDAPHWAVTPATLPFAVNCNMPYTISLSTLSGTLPGIDCTLPLSQTGSKPRGQGRTHSINARHTRHAATRRLPAERPMQARDRHVTLQRNWPACRVDRVVAPMSAAKP